MHKVVADPNQNRLYLWLGVLEGEGEILQVVEELKVATGQLQPGFDCITDLRDYTVRAEKEEQYIRQGQAVLVAAGMKRVVRIRKKFGLWGHLQFNRTSASLGYHAHNVTTMEEAETLLQKLAAGSDKETPS